MAVTALIIFILAVCSPWQTAYASRAKVEDGSMALASKGEGQEAVNVRLLLTRHALSCANAVDQFGVDITHKKMHIFMLDPMLTNCGVHRSKQGAKDLLKINDFHVDLVLSSSMLRAMETAAFMFPDHTITPVPYISEQGQGLDNKPKAVQNQLKTLAKDAVVNRSGLSDDRLDVSWISSGPFSDAPRKTPSWSKFKTFMAENLLPTLPSHLQKKDLTIAVVTHSHFLKAIPELISNCKEYFSDKPKNNQVFELNYLFTTEYVLKQLPDSIEASMRDFKFQDGTGCKSLIEVQGKQTETCQRDFGDVCEAEIQAMSKITRPRLNFWDTKRIRLENLVVKHMENGDEENYQKAKDELVAVHNDFTCCTFT